MTQELQKKIDRAIRLLKSIKVNDGEFIEVAYSGGKDSDVILQLAKEAEIPYRAIYRNTTIDPPHTIKHCKDNGVEIRNPKETFYHLMCRKGWPNRWARFCCSELKEYKILDKCIMGVRRAESKKRAARYKEPTQCRFYGSKKNHVEAIYPILDWTNEDVVEFVKDRGIKLHPLYYKEDGSIDPSRRLGCMCCPLARKKNRIKEFKDYPKMVKMYIKAGNIFRASHPNAKVVQLYKDEYEHFVRDVFFEKQSDFNAMRDGLFDEPDYKAFLEDYFGIRL